MSIRANPRLLIATLLWPAAALAAASAVAEESVVAYRCPPRITTAQTLAAPVPEWRPSVDYSFAAAGKTAHTSEHPLDSVMFFEGQPEDGASLVPDNENEATGNVWDARWDFTRSETIWFACTYRQTTVLLSRQLPAGIRSCFARFDNAAGLTVRKVWCER